jgi:hypothetical protein
MPFKSKAQRRKFAELLVKGEISPETFEAWNRETGKAKLPEHVKPATKRRKRGKVRSKRRPPTQRGRRSRKKAGRRRKTS